MRTFMKFMIGAPFIFITTMMTLPLFQNVTKNEDEEREIRENLKEKYKKFDEGSYSNLYINDDLEAMAYDWQMIGNDMRGALDEYAANRK